MQQRRFAFRPLIVILIVGIGSFAYSEPDPAGQLLSIRGNRKIENFPEAKRLLKQVFAGHEETLYCGCRYYGKELNLNSCGIAIDNAPKRLKRLEWEHMVPAAKFGEAIAAWHSGDVTCVSKKGHAHGRKCAEKASPLFRQMEGDLYNLWPESGEINGARSNKPPVENLLASEIKPKVFGVCQTQIGPHAFLPRPEVRGIVARAYLYMNWAYEVAITPEQKIMFEKWDREAPPTPWECERDARVKALQGNENPFAAKACAKL